MKKLMTVAAAALCATAFGAIESTNIVGYQTKGLKTSTGTEGVFTFVAPTFLSVAGSDQLTLGDFKLTVGDLTPRVGLLTEGGAIDGWYYYVDSNPANLAAAGKEDPGWYVREDNGDVGDPANDTLVVFGRGFVIDNGTTDCKIIFTGAVCRQDVAVKSDLGGGAFYFTGNVRPADCVLRDHAYLEYTDANAAGQWIMKLGDNGEVVQKYYYVNPAASTFEQVDVGWYTDSTFTPGSKVSNTEKLDPGEGVVLIAGKANTKFVVKTAAPQE